MNGRNVRVNTDNNTIINTDTDDITVINSDNHGNTSTNQQNDHPQRSTRDRRQFDPNFMPSGIL